MKIYQALSVLIFVSSYIYSGSDGLVRVREADLSFQQFTRAQQELTAKQQAIDTILETNEFSVEQQKFLGAVSHQCHVEKHMKLAVAAIALFDALSNPNLTNEQRALLEGHAASVWQVVAPSDTGQ